MTIRENALTARYTLNARWRNVVAEIPEDEIGPHFGETASLHIARQTRIATLGSCFAQHLSKSLAKYGFNYVNGEPGPSWLDEQDRIRFNYGTFSARYGNIYTPRQLVQLVERSLGMFGQEPAEVLEFRRIVQN